MNILEAAQAMSEGKKVRRAEWLTETWREPPVFSASPRGTHWVIDSWSDTEAKMWLPDLLADDWEIAP